MAITEFIKEIDMEIARLKEARALLAGTSGSEVRRSPPKESEEPLLPTKSAKKKRNFTPEHRARIAAAQKRRWTNQKSKTK
jgi:hypothetical protein